MGLPAAWLALAFLLAAHVALSVSARGVITTRFTDRPFDWWMWFREVFFLNFDWEMMTYCAIVGASPRRNSIFDRK